MTDVSRRMYLTRPQAIEALTTDLCQYDPAPPMLEALSDLLLSPRIRVVADARKERYWISITSKKWWSPMRSLDRYQLRDHLVQTIDNLDPEDPRLPKICQLVFDSAAYIDQEHPHGIWVETGMAGFRCRQCGRCCSSLDYQGQLTQADVDRWRAQGRNDILDWVAGIDTRDTPTYRIWVKKGEMQLARQCPWLTRDETQDRYLCRIHDTKPEVCRNYPGTRRHALKTGCKGFDPC